MDLESPLTTTLLQLSSTAESRVSTLAGSFTALSELFERSSAFLFRNSFFLLAFLLNVEGLSFFPGAGGLLLPGVQGEGEAGAGGAGEGEREGQALANQRLAEVQALQGRGGVLSNHCCHFRIYF